MGAAGGATLGLAVASLAVPGIGPIIAFGMVGAGCWAWLEPQQALRLAILLKKNWVKASLTKTSIFMKTLYVTGTSVVIAYADDGDQADKLKKS